MDSPLKTQCDKAVNECFISTEFLRGSNSSWLTEQNKEDISYGAGQGHSLEWWRIFIRQCYCLRIIDKKVSVQVVSSQQHAVCTTIHNTAVGHSLVSSRLTEGVLLPQTLLHKPAMAIKRKKTTGLVKVGTQQVIMHCKDITALSQYTPNNLHFYGLISNWKREFQQRSFSYINNR